MADAQFDRLTAPSGPSNAESAQLGVQILQQGTVLRQFPSEGEPVAVVVPDPGAFTLRFRGTDGESARICAALEDTVHDPIPDTDESDEGSGDQPSGNSGDRMPCLAADTATPRNPFDTSLKLSTTSHNAFYPEAFRPVEGGQVVDVSTIEDFAGQDMDLASFHDSLFLLVWVDHDGDRHIDFDETDRLRLEF